MCILFCFLYTYRYSSWPRRDRTCIFCSLTLATGSSIHVRIYGAHRNVWNSKATPRKLFDDVRRHSRQLLYFRVIENVVRVLLQVEMSNQRFKNIQRLRTNLAKAEIKNRVQHHDGVIRAENSNLLKRISSSADTTCFSTHSSEFEADIGAPSFQDCWDSANTTAIDMKKAGIVYIHYKIGVTRFEGQRCYCKLCKVSTKCRLGLGLGKECREHRWACRSTIFTDSDIGRSLACVLVNLSDKPSFTS